MPAAAARNIGTSAAAVQNIEISAAADHFAGKPLLKIPNNAAAGGNVETPAAAGQKSKPLLRQYKTLKSLLWQTILQGNPCSKFQNNAAAGENDRPLIDK
jgi:hypothetical protein